MNLKKLAYLSSCLAIGTFFSTTTNATEKTTPISSQKSLEQRIQEMEASINQLKQKNTAGSRRVKPGKTMDYRLKEMEESIRQIKLEVASKKVKPLVQAAPQVTPIVQAAPQATPIVQAAPQVNPNELSIKVGGRVKLDAYYDVDAIEGTYGVFGGLMPLYGINPDAKRNGHTDFALAGSQFSIEANQSFSGLPTREYLEVDFSKDSSTTTSSYSPRIRHFYMESTGLLVGQTNYTFSDPEAYGRSLDNLYAQGRQAMIKYTHKFSNCLKLAMAAEKPVSQYIDTAGNFFDNTNDGQSKIPDFATQLRYDYSNIGHIAFSGVARRLGAKTAIGLNNALTSFTANSFGYGLGISGKVKFYQNNAFFGQINGGRGIGRYIDDLNNNNGQDFYLQVPTTANPNVTSRFNVLRAFNILGGFEFWPDEKININMAASITKIHVPDGMPNVPNFNRNLQRYFGNLIYKVLPNSEVALQLMHYKRRAGTTLHYSGKDTRILTSFIYKF